jgi:hypothetical protein
MLWSDHALQRTRRGVAVSGMNEWPLVSASEAKQTPYPYVLVEDNGTYRELTQEDKDYLEEPFSPADSGRPYVKHSLYQRTPDGLIGGYLKRSKLPRGLAPGHPIPPESPHKRWWRFWTVTL